MKTIYSTVKVYDMYSAFLHLVFNNKSLRNFLGSCVITSYLETHTMFPLIRRLQTERDFSGTPERHLKFGALVTKLNNATFAHSNRGS